MHFFLDISHRYVCLLANRSARKAIFLAFALVFLSSLQGGIVLATYVPEIFASTNTNISALNSSSIITMIVIIANLIFLNVVDRAGRRTFYIWSSIGTAVGFTLFALYLCFLTDDRAFDWVPVVCLSFALFVKGLGMYPVPWLIILETMPQKVFHFHFHSTFHVLHNAHTSFSPISADQALWLLKK